MKHLVSAALAVAIAVPPLLAARAAAQPRGEEERRWNEPVEPFRIAGNVYYVGAREVTSHLIATPAGHLVIDCGFAATVPQVLANIRTLGFDPRDVKWLLISHPHYDHVGGIADLRDATEEGDDAHRRAAVGAEQRIDLVDLADQLRPSQAPLPAFAVSWIPARAGLGARFALLS